MTANEMEMLRTLEDARKASEMNPIVFAMSNGHEIKIAIGENAKQTWEQAHPEYWVCSIFEWGHRVEA